MSNLSYANANRDYRIFEEFAYHMINLAQSKRITRPFVLNGKFYAFDSTMIDLCMSLFEWAYFRKFKSGIKVHHCHIGDLCLNESRRVMGWIHFINSVEPMVAKQLNEMLENFRHEDLKYFINAYGYIENL